MMYLDRNENQFGPAPECYSILRNATKNDLSNYSRDFMRGVKSTLSEALAREYGLPESSLLLSYGSEDMLKQIVHCYLAASETMMVPKYSWWYYKSVAGEVGGSIVEFPMHEDKTSFYYDIDEIVLLVRTVKPRLLLVASPNNPTGNSISVNDMKLLLRKCTDTMFVIDEAYYGFTNSPDDVMPLLTLEHPHLAVLRTFSKLYALAGIRIGHAFVGKSYQKLVTYSMRYLGYNRLSERLALAALRDKIYYASLASTTAAERQRYYEFFQAVEGCTVYRSDANFILVKILNEDCEPLKNHLAEASIFVKFFSEREFPDYMRITVGTPAQNTLLIGEMKKYFAHKNVLIPEQH
ncbi:MAG: aminotransferase class I/II-fold pyridoxal phosphate-dependent enzyme [Bacteroidota bacterium]